MSMLVLFIICLVFVNVSAFALMAYDKHCAKTGKYRVPEKILFMVTAAFGGLGGVLGMFLCRHMTKHWYFRVFFPLLLAVQIPILWYVISLLLKTGS